MIINTLLKFMLVGTGGTVLDFGITYFFKEKVNFNKYLANSIGFACAASSNYVFNRIWAFDSDSTNIVWQYFIFITISLLGLGILNLCILLMHEKMQLNFYLSKVLALFMVLVWTFLAHYFITFSVI